MMDRFKIIMPDTREMKHVTISTPTNNTKFKSANNLTSSYAPSNTTSTSSTTLKKLVDLRDLNNNRLHHHTTPFNSANNSARASNKSPCSNNNNNNKSNKYYAANEEECYVPPTLATTYNDDYTTIHINNNTACNNYTSPASLTSNTESNNKKVLHLPKFYLDGKKATNRIKKDIHQKIIDIGDSIHETIIRDMRNQHEMTMKQRLAEQDEKNRYEKQIEFEHEQAKCQTSIDIAKKQIKLEYDRVLREKIAEIELFTHNIAKEQIELNKREARAHLDNTVQILQSKLDVEKRMAVESAIETEHAAANVRMNEQRAANEEHIAEMNERWRAELNRNVNETRTRMQKEKERAVVQAREEENAEASKEMLKLTEAYETKLDKAKKDLQREADEVVQLTSSVSLMQAENDELRKGMDELRDTFQSCIEHFSHLKKKEADFLFPINERLIKKKLKT